MRTGLYFKTKTLILVIIAILAFMGVAAAGAVFYPSQQTTANQAQSNIEEVSQVNAVATKQLVIKNVTLFNVNNGEKIYDGSKNVVIESREISGIEGNDDVRLSSFTCTAAQKNVGENIELTYNATLTGDQAAEYEVVFDANIIKTINIKPAVVVLNGVRAENKVYDKSPEVKLIGGALQGAVAGDDVSFNILNGGKGTVNSVSAGDNKAVQYSAELTGADSANYTLSSQLGAVKVNISRAPITATWGQLVFTYDKTQHIPTVTVNGMLDGDVVHANAQFNNNAATDGINVIVNGGYSVGLVLSGEHAQNYAVKDAYEKVIIKPIIATVQFTGDDTFIANIPNPNLKPIDAVVTNALEGDDVKCVLAQHTANRPGRYMAQITGLSNTNYTLQGSSSAVTKSYIVRTSYVANYATTPLKLSIDIIDQTNGFDPNAIFYVEKIDKTNALFSKLKKEEKPYASYKVRMTIEETPMDLNGTYTYSMYIPKDQGSDAKYVKIALYDGTSVKELELEIKDGMVTFEATNLLEMTVVLGYEPIFVWLWVVLGILALVAVIVMIWLLIFFLGKRKLLFDPNGGEPVEGIAGRFHQEISLPETHRDAHMFNGWFKDKKFNGEVKTNRLPFWDTVLVAKWLDADGIPVPYVPGSTILPAAREATVAPELNNEIDAQNQAVVRTITMNTRGGLPIPPISAIKGAKVELPIPNKANDAFVGWYQDDKFKAEALIGVMPKKSVTIYAKWASDRDIAPQEALTIKVDKSDKTRTLTFDSRGGSRVEPIVAVKKSKIEIPEPVKEGETFAYWSTDSKILTKKIKLDVMPTEDMKVYAVYASDLNPTGVAITEEAKRNEALNEPVERKPFNPQEFNRVVGVPSAVDDKIDALMFGKAVMPSSRPLVDQAKQAAEIKPVAQEPVVEVTKKAIVEPVTVTEDKQTLQEKLLVKAILFNTRGGSGLKPLQAKMGTPIELPTPIKGESKFLGWFKDESLLKSCDFTKMPSKNTMLFAKWIEDATVQELFDSGLTDEKTNKAFDDDQAQIDRIFAADEKGMGMDDIVIQRTATKKSSLIVDDSKKER